MSDFVKHGGYVVTTRDKQIVSIADVDQRKLQQIAEILGIKTKDREQLAAESIRTIFIYAPDKS